MTLFTNKKIKFKKEIEKELKNCVVATIAVGYFGTETINNFEKNIKKIVRQKKGRFCLILGMAKFEGLTRPQLEIAKKIHNLTKSEENISGVKIQQERPFHGKIYYFKHRSGESAFIGSSNFSPSGLTENLEANLKIKDADTIKQIKDYLKFLAKTSNIFSPSEIRIKQGKSANRLLGTKKSQRKISKEKIIAIPIVKKGLVYTKSGLNKFNAKGRPRDWYETEIIALKAQLEHPDYPKGNFTAVTDNGEELKMHSSGVNNKNISTRRVPDQPGSGEQDFGKWIKGKLIQAGVLLEGDLITTTTLEAYGTEVLKLSKISNKKYYMEFTPE